MWDIDYISDNSEIVQHKRTSETDKDVWSYTLAYIAYVKYSKITILNSQSEFV